MRDQLEPSQSQAIASLRSKSRYVAIGAVIVGVVGIGIGAVFLLGHLGKRTDKKAGAGSGSGSGSAQTFAGSGSAGDVADQLIAAEEALYDKTNCDQQALENLNEQLFEKKRYARVVERVDQFIAKCGDEDATVRWNKFTALKRLEKWPEAEAEATTLITRKPTDVDYWWWRAEVRKKKDDLVGAVADLKQSISLSEIADSNGVHVMMLGEIADDASVPCDGAMAFRLYRRQSDGDLNSTAERLHDELELAGDCSRVVGKGAGAITPMKGEAVLTARARVGSANGRFWVTKETPYVVIDRKLANRAGLDGDGPEVDLVIAGKIVRGNLTKANQVVVGSSSAADVDVAVVDDGLPPRLDGVLGHSFLMRFAYEFAGDGVDLAVY
jgi:hypothetical protein